MGLYQQEAETGQSIRGKYCSDTEGGSECDSLSTRSEQAHGLLQLLVADFNLGYI